MKEQENLIFILKRLQVFIYHEKEIAEWQYAGIS